MLSYTSESIKGAMLLGFQGKHSSILDLFAYGHDLLIHSSLLLAVYLSRSIYMVTR